MALPMAVDDIRQWNENELQLINEWITYGQQIVNLCTELKEFGDTSLAFPRLPKQHIKDLLDGVKLKKPRLGGIELHKYLVSKLVDSHTTAMPTLLFLKADSTLDDMLVYLKLGFNCISQKNSQILSVYVDYGAWLNVAYTTFDNQKLKGFIKMSWATWLLENVGIRDAYARKLRVLARLCEGYPRMRKLGIPMNEIYDLRKEISELFTSNTDNCVAYWKSV